MALRMTGREWRLLAGALAGLAVVIQFLPVGAPRDNPPVRDEPRWSSPRTRDLFFRSCSDCHSNQTRWPWYARVAPVSWLVAHDVQGGRSHLNVSEWNRPQKDADEAAEELRDGKMPLRTYLLAHPGARLSPAEKAELIAGLEATFGTRSGSGRDRERAERDFRR
ncbi:MAG: heme-binding protein [Acidobacteria bacterium]|jgi:mono/diheme cytochrome c family protein|nr:heme-binding protein [Acidobacteriota bacterium]